MCTQLQYLKTKIVIICNNNMEHRVRNWLHWQNWIDYGCSTILLHMERIEYGLLTHATWIAQRDLTHVDDIECDLRHVTLKVFSSVCMGVNNFVWEISNFPCSYLRPFLITQSFQKYDITLNYFKNYCNKPIKWPKLHKLTQIPFLIRLWF